MRIRLSKKNPLLWLYAGGVVLLLVAVWLWCFKVSIEPERVFWATVERSLATRGVTIQAEHEDNGTNVKQTVRYSFGVNNIAHSRTAIDQGKTKVVNEMIGVPGTDYSRYISIHTDQKKADGGKIDPSSVVGVWAKGPGGLGRFFSQTALGTSLPVGGLGMPVGNVPSEARAQLMKQVRDDVVYEVDFKKVKKERVNGRLRYTYDVKLQAVAYVAFVKRFAEHLGLHDLDQLDPETYKGQKPFAIKLTIDVRSRQLVVAEAVENDRKQTYTSYDVPVQLELPKKTITSQELQKRLADLQ